MKNLTVYPAGENAGAPTTLRATLRDTVRASFFTGVTRASTIVMALLLALTSFPLKAVESQRWEELKSGYFGDRTIIEGDDVITLEAPKRAHDAATVPVVVRTVDPGRQVKQVHLIVDMNPLPLAGIFKFSEEAGAWNSLETRIRINEYTHVRAIGELHDGTLHMTSRFVKAAGGCSAPAMSDMQAAMARAGKMKLALDDISTGGAKSSEAVIKISHPNNSGMQFDQVSRNYIPAFFVHTITAEVDGKPLIDVETNFSMSENPVVRFNFPADANHSELVVSAIDSKGNEFKKLVVASP